MPEIGRNEPCPCGSGKKYKRCCLPLREEEDRAARILGTALGHALDWLFEAHGEPVQAAIEKDFFAAPDREAIRQLFDGLPGDLRETLEVNLNDWLLADARIEVGGVRRSAVDLLADEGGPSLEAVARERIAEMASRPLGLYEVEASRADGLQLRDVLTPAAPSLFVKEPQRPDSPRAGALLGARPVADGDGLILSGSLYPFPPSLRPAIEDRVRAALHGRSPASGDADAGGAAVGQAIIDTWLDCLAVTLDTPELVDRASGESLRLLTDHYQVTDWERLAAALADAGDVLGSRADGWVRRDGKAARPGALLSLRPAAGDGLAVAARSERRADEGKAWLAELAGGAVAFESRDEADPRQAWRLPKTR